jgi:biopolymer transport protein ExbB
MLEQISNVPGIIAIVVAAFLVLTFIIAADRYLYLHRARVDTFELLRGILSQLRAGRVKEAVANCDAKTGPVGEILRTGIEHWRDGGDAVRHSVEETGRLLIPRLERNLKLLAAFANVTPIVGLLGTLVSLIGAFDKISNIEFQGAQVLSGDIKMALLCTAMGLLASLVSQICHAVLVEKVDHLLEEMGKAASEITYFLTHNPPPAEEETP